MARWFVLLPSLWGCWLNMLLWRVIPRLFSYCVVWQMLTATLTCNDFCNCCEWQRLWPCCAGWTIFGVQNCLVQRGFHFLCYSQLSLFGHFVFFKPPQIFCSNLSGLFLPIDWSGCLSPSSFLWLFHLALITSSSLSTCHLSLLFHCSLRGSY